MMRFKISASLALFVFFVVGCGGPQIKDQEGRPVNTDVYQIGMVGDIGFTVTFFVNGYFLKEIETKRSKMKEEVFWPKPFDVRKPFDVAPNIEHLVFYVQVRNPKKLNYQVWKEIVVEKEGENPLFSQQMISSSSGEVVRRFEISCPIKEKDLDVEFNVVIKNSSEKEVFRLFPAKYTVWS